MAVTLQQIAQMAGVSRGTVDRALNNRGRIKPEVAEKIREIAKEAGYEPSRAGRALSVAKKNLRIGVIIQRLNTPFMWEVLEGIEAGKKEAESLGVTVEVHKMEKADASKVINIMEDMRSRDIKGIALSPTADGYLMQNINKFVNEYDIPIVTFNSDLEESERFCFVGQNALKSGQVAGALMGEIIEGRGQVVVISSRNEQIPLEERSNGFIGELKDSYPQVEVLGVHYAYEDNWVAEKIVEECLKEYPYLKGIYITGMEVIGVCRAIKKAGKSKMIKIIANDLIKNNIKYLKDGTINFLIGQDAYTQGYKPIMTLFHKLVDDKKPEDKLQYTDIIIKNKYNI